MNVVAVSIIIGIVAAAAIGVAVLSLAEQDQTQTPVPRVSQPSPQTAGEPADKWDDEPVTFRDSLGYIPDVMISQQWTNGDASQACGLILEDTNVASTVTAEDLNWCTEFMNSSQ